MNLGPVSKDTPKAKLRFAPSFLMREKLTVERERPYSAEQLGIFLG